MKFSQLLLFTFLVAAASSVVAEDGSDRSASFLADFRQEQQRLHGPLDSVATVNAGDNVNLNAADNEEDI